MFKGVCACGFLLHQLYTYTALDLDVIIFCYIYLGQFYNDGVLFMSFL